MKFPKPPGWTIAIILGSLIIGLGVLFPFASGSAALSISNQKTEQTTVYVSFGADSKITADDWSFCNGSGLNCNFDLAGSGSKSLPNPNGDYINATFSFGAAVGCGVTKAEVNINNPNWYDTLDVSLVDGYSDNVQIVVTDVTGTTNLGPPLGKAGNEKVYGLFPYGCDICVERQNPPCGTTKGKTGCKTGTQYDPDVPCQFQGQRSGSRTVEVQLQ
jgi:hypothetical protein